MAFRSEEEGMGGEGGLEPELSLKLGSGQEGSAKDEFVQKKEKKKMTIFFNGDMRVLDVTETQARAIICSAMKQIENEKKSRIHQGSIDTGNNMFWHKDAPSHENVSVPCSQAAVLPAIQPSELSMKQSLQRFLQKRKARMAAASPYSQKQLLSLSLS